MATSGSVNYSNNAGEIIKDAFLLAGILGPNQSPAANDQAFANRMLNRMIKAWNGQGAHLFTNQEAYLFPTTGQAEYTFATDHITTSAVITRLNGAHSSSDTTLDVDTTSGMTAGDYIGVVLSDDSVHWTTIVSVDSATALTITTGISGAASDNGPVYTYTTKMSSPLHVTSVRRAMMNSTNVIEVPLTAISREEFYDYPNKDTGGVVVSYYYDKQRSAGKLHFYLNPNDGADYYRISCQRSLEDLDATTDDFDLPAEWLEAVTYGLASRLAMTFGVPAETLDRLQASANAFLRDALAWDNEDASVFLNVDIRRR